MTDVIIAPRVEDATSDVESIVTGAYFRIRPSAVYTASGQWVLPVWPAATTPISGTAVTVKLDPLPTTPYELELTMPDGMGGDFVVHEYRIVPSSGVPVTWESCAQVAGPTGTPVLTDAITLRLDAQDAAIAALSVSGASDVSTVSGISVFARTYLDDTTASATRTTLGAGTSNLAIGTTAGTVADAATTVNVTGAQTVAGVKTFSASPIVPTPTTDTQAAPKAYVDSVAGSGTVVDATTSVKGKIKLAGDLSGTADLPTVVGLSTALTTITSLSSADVAIDSRLDAIEAGVAVTAQEMIFNGNLTSTNATSYGTYDATRAIHFFRGERNPVDAGYTLAVDDRWFQPEVLAVEPDPDPPTTITLTVTDQTTTGFRLNWTAVPGSTGYRVTRDQGGGESAPWPTTPAGTATDGPDVRFRDVIYLVANSTYVVTVTALPSNITASKTVVLGAATPPTEPPPPPTPTGDNKYGFMVFLPGLGVSLTQVDNDIAGIVAAGGTWARLGMYTSGSFNTSGIFLPNTQIWDVFKYACQKAKAAGLKVIWDAADTIRLSATLTDAQWIVWQKSMWAYMAQTLGPWVDAWQIFNEHDGRHIRDFSAVPTLTTGYLNLVRDALIGAKAAIRTYHAGPVGTTVFGYPMDEARIAKWFQWHDVVSATMDYIGLHAYPEFNGAVLTDFLNRVYARYSKPIALLEFGVPDASGYGVPPLFLRVGDGIVIQNNAALAAGKSKLLCVTLFSLRNRALGGTGEGGFGILDADWRKKAYWTTVVNSIARWN